MRYNDRGEEMPDGTPVEVPLKFRITEQDRVHMEVQRYLMSQAFAVRANSAEVDTEEEANDFDVDDDVDLPLSSAEKAFLMAEEVRSAKQDLLDSEGNLYKNKRTVNVDRDRKEASNGIESARVGDDREGVSDAGKERAASGGEGRSAGQRSSRVPEGRERDRESREKG